ncbi:MAG: type II secretion system protein [Pirellulales bacterium]
MKLNLNRAARRGLTLIELVVVMAILAVLAAMVIPRLDFLKTQAEHSASAGTQADIGTIIQTFKSSSNTYPSLDTLVSTDGTLYSKLQGQTTGSFLEATPIPGASTGSGWYRSLSDAGFTYGYRHDASATNASNSATSVVDLVNEGSQGTLTLATVKVTGGDMSGLGSGIRGAIYPGGATYNPAVPAVGVEGDAGYVPAVPASWSQVAAGTIPSTSKLVVFGIGPKSNLIGKVMTSAPISSMGSDDSSSTYCRYLAVFEIYSNGTPAKLKMITDHRGRQIGARLDLYKTGNALN